LFADFVAFSANRVAIVDRNAAPIGAIATFAPFIAAFVAAIASLEAHFAALVEDRSTKCETTGEEGEANGEVATTNDEVNETNAERYCRNAVRIASSRGFCAWTVAPDATYPSLIVQMIVPPSPWDFAHAPFAAIDVASS
jgi:hypothetical protein